jgi:hypothetical protein
LVGFKSNTLYATMLLSMFHRFILRSSADKKVSPSEDTLREFILYWWQFLYYFFSIPSKPSLTISFSGRINCCSHFPPNPAADVITSQLVIDYLWTLYSIFHNFMILSFVERNDI